MPDPLTPLSILSLIPPDLAQMIGVTICICVVLWSFGLFDGRGAGGDSSLFDGWDGGDGGDGGSD